MFDLRRSQEEYAINSHFHENKNDGRFINANSDTVSKK
jgi:hypothetical protein